MEKENISNEDLVYEEIRQELLTPKKRKKIILKPRQEFELENHNWVDFLNDYHKGRLINEGNNKIDAFFHSWQSENGSMYYESFQDFILALARWMYENLKIIGRGGKPELIDIECFGVKQVNKILALLQPIVLHKIENEKFIFYENWDFGSCSDAESRQSMICLAKILFSYITYIEKFYNGTAKYRVSVCPYYKGKGVECGKIVVTERFGETCDKHRKLWVQRRIDKAKRGKAVLYKK